jgi:hypothetical protein
MLQNRTHYEQVPVEQVRKILEEQARLEPEIEKEHNTRAKTAGKDLLREQQLSAAFSSDRFQGESEEQ